MQRAPQGDVHLLDAAADPEHRDFGSHAGAHERQHRVVAGRIDDLVVGERGPVKMMWFHIRAATREQQPVDTRDYVLSFHALTEARDDDGYTVAELLYRVDVLCARDIAFEPAIREVGQARDDTNQWFRRIRARVAHRG